MERLYFLRHVRRCVAVVWSTRQRLVFVAHGALPNLVTYNTTRDCPTVAVENICLHVIDHARFESGI